MSDKKSCTYYNGYALDTVSQCKGYIRKRRIRNGRCTFSWAVYGKTIYDVYYDLYRASSLDPSRVGSVPEHLGLVNILNLGSPNHNKRLVYDYGSAVSNKEFDSIQAVRVTIRKNVIDIYVYMPEKPSKKLLKYIDKYHDKWEV